MKALADIRQLDNEQQHEHHQEPQENRRNESELLRLNRRLHVVCGTMKERK